MIDIANVRVTAGHQQRLDLMRERFGVTGTLSNKVASTTADIMSSKTPTSASCRSFAISVAERESNHSGGGRNGRKWRERRGQVGKRTRGNEGNEERGNRREQRKQRYAGAGAERHEAMAGVNFLRAF